MQSLVFNQIASPCLIQFSLLRQPPPHRSPVRLLTSSHGLAARRPRASWHPSKISLIFCTFAKTDLGILQENPNVLQLLTWHPSKPRNIHAPLRTPKIRAAVARPYVAAKVKSCHNPPQARKKINAVRQAASSGNWRPSFVAMVLETTILAVAGMSSGGPPSSQPAGCSAWPHPLA